jgi:hypothetical protein
MDEVAVALETLVWPEYSAQEQGTFAFNPAVYNIKSAQIARSLPY